MPDAFATYGSSLSAPLTGGFSITPDDNNDLAQTTRQIRVTGTGGNIALVWASGLASTEPVNAGDMLDWRVARVKATGTTATGLRGYF
jgi:hypothetical protein